MRKSLEELSHSLTPVGFQCDQLSTDCCCHESTESYQKQQSATV